MSDWPYSFRTLVIFPIPKMAFSFPSIPGAAGLLPCCQMASPEKKKCGMYIYCKPDERARLKRVIEAKRAKLSGYVMNAVMNKVEADERKLSLNPR